tara:strand:- start:8371 stop:9846 length:1476 start_codon:yes stop_codon:yes gene_type:complete
MECFVMRLTRISFALALVGLFGSGSALAQGQVPSSVDQTAFNYDSYYAAEAATVAAQPRDSEGALGETGPPIDVMDNDFYGDEGRYAPMPGLNWSCGCDYELDCGPMWTLQRCENDMLNYGGWLSGGFTVNNWGNTTMLGNAQLPFNNDPHVNLNQAWMWFQKETDTGGYGFDWGYQVDIMAGIDGPDTQAFGGPGWDSTWQWGNGGYGAAIPQAYLSLGYDDVTVILGHFFTIMGYEVVPAPYNFFYSHAYTFAYGEPFTHTGILAEYSYSDQLSFYGGWVDGWDEGFNFGANGSSTFLGGVMWNSADERTAVSWTVNAGDWGKGANIHPNQTTGPTTMSEGTIYSQSLVIQQQIRDNWTYVFQTDYAYNRTRVPGGVDTEWYGVNNYLFYNFNCAWAAGLRAEWFSDPDGARVDRAGLNAGNVAFDRANYFEITVGANYRPNNNFRLRPEIRYDWSNGMGTGGPRFDPVGGSYTQADLWTFGLDAIWMF